MVVVVVILGRCLVFIVFFVCKKVGFVKIICEFFWCECKFGRVV